VTGGGIDLQCPTGNCASTVYFMTSGCTGEPYYTSKIGRDVVLPVSNYAAFVRSTGSEVLTTYGPFQAKYLNGSCSVSGWGSFSSYRISTSYTYPAGVTPPPYAGIPMYYGP